MADQKNYREQAAEACIRFSAVLDEINSFKSQIAEALERCEKPFEMLAGQCGPDPIYVAQTHLGRYFQNGGRLPVDSWLGEEPADELDSDIFECEACLEAFKLCIQRKKLRQKRGQALRLVRYYGRKAREVTRG